MAPVAKAINILQGENNVHMGWLVLKRAKVSMRLCKSLVDAILAGVNKRFGDMFNDSELFKSLKRIGKLMLPSSNSVC